MATPYEGTRWEGLHSRVTDEDLALSIRIDPKTGEKSTVAFTREGALELPGTEAYFHPNITPGIDHVKEVDPWDEALDELNTLTNEARIFVLRGLEAAKRKKEDISAYSISSAAKRVSEKIGLDRAA